MRHPQGFFFVKLSKRGSSSSWQIILPPFLNLEVYWLIILLPGERLFYFFEMKEYLMVINRLQVP